MSGPIAYPGSIELTTSEGVKDAKKGFFQVDISSQEAKTNWIELDTRPQFLFNAEYNKLAKSIDEISQKIKGIQRKPIIEIKIQGEDVEIDHIQAQISRLQTLALRCFWKITSKVSDSSVFLDRPNVIDDEMFRLSIDSLGSHQAAHFVVKELLPLLSTGQTSEATQIIMENFEKFKGEEK
jgi:hypothetical protein